MITTLGPALSWRLIHDGKTVLLLAELAGYTETAHAAFEAVTQQECVAVARDATLAALYALLDEVQAGQRPVPQSFDDVAPLLPELEWPQ